MDMKSLLLPVLLAEHEKYTAMYLSQVSDDLPGKREWLKSLEGSAAEYDTTEYFAPIRDAAGGTEDPAEILALLNGLVEVQKNLKEWLSGMFAAMNNNASNKTDGVSTPEEIQGQLKMVRDAFDACLSMVRLNQMTEADIKEALTFTSENEDDPEVRWEMRNTRGNPVFTYKPVGTVKVRTVTTNAVGPKSNSKRYRLVVDGELSPEVQFGEACRKAGIEGSVLQAAVVEGLGKDAWTNETKYSDNMVTINGHTYGLRMSKS